MKTEVEVNSTSVFDYIIYSGSKSPKMGVFGDWVDFEGYSKG